MTKSLGGLELPAFFALAHPMSIKAATTAKIKLLPQIVRIMYSTTMFRQALLLSLAFALASLGRAQQSTTDQLTLGPNGQLTSSSATNAPATSTSAINASPAGSNPGTPPIDPNNLLLRQAYMLLTEKQPDAALVKVNALILASPKNPAAYALRGTIYAEKKLWDQAEKDYRTVLQFDSKDSQMKFDLAEIQFLQKKYDLARPGFVALQQDPDMQDLAAYKVFLCDLFGGHEDTAAKELDVFNQAGRNASYYFGNVAWSLYHHKTEDARGWLTSAADIYAPKKCLLYATSLFDLGYLPLTSVPAQSPRPSENEGL
jgi:Flp pilus assembly protein TadD